MKGILFVVMILALSYLADGICEDVISPLWALPMVPPAIIGMYKIIMEAID